MLNRYRQTGAFLLVTIVFLMAAGGAMLYAMANLSSASSATATLAHNGNMALLAAQSGLKYCVAGLGSGGCNTPPVILGITTTTQPPTLPAAPCTIAIVDGCSGAATPSICTITSTANCPGPADPFRGTKTLTVQMQKTAGGYQMIPASRR